MAKSTPPTGRGMTRDGLTVSHIANRIGAVPVQEGLTTAHLAQGLAQGQASGSSSTGQGTNSQSPAPDAATTQAQTGGKS
jgi:hypothetical protein